VFDFLLYAASALLVLVWIRVELIAKQLSALHEGLASLQRELGVSPPLSPEPSTKVRQLAVDPKAKIEAIKTYRRESGADLRQAKRIVEQLRSSRSDA
jgi:ribosomal protein L7/L12